MTYFWFVLVLLGLVVADSTLNETKSQPKLIICWENHVDALVYLASGQLYALKAGWAWQLSIDYQRSTLHQDEDVHHRIGTLWPGLPDEFDFVFTMPKLNVLEASRHGSTSGRTIFAKSPNYYSYHDFTRMENTTRSMIHWDASQFADNRFVFTMHGTALVLVAKIGFIPDGIKSLVGGNVYMFDSEQFPERVGFFEMAAGGLPWLKLKQMIPIQSPTGTVSSLYLALFNYASLGSYYCIFSISRTGLSTCRLHPVASTLDCPTALMSFKRSNWAVTLYEYSGASLHQLILFLLGALAGAIWTLAILTAHTLKAYHAFFSGNVQLKMPCGG